jgi:hypothetical protein
MDQPTITPTDDGPYLVQGHVSLIDADGNAYKVNGSHEKTYFHAVNRADKVLSLR